MQILPASSFREVIVVNISYSNISQECVENITYHRYVTTDISAVESVEPSVESVESVECR